MFNTISQVWQYAEPIIYILSFVIVVITGYFKRHWLLGFKNVAQAACGVYIPAEMYNSVFLKQHSIRLTDDEKEKPYVIRWLTVNMMMHPEDIGSWPQASIERADKKAAYHQALLEDLGIKNTKARKIFTLGSIKMSRDIRARVFTGMLALLNPLVKWWFSKGKHYTFYVGFIHAKRFEDQELQFGANVRKALFFSSDALLANFQNALTYFDENSKQLKRKVLHTKTFCKICKEAEKMIANQLTFVEQKRDLKAVQALFN